MDLNEAKNLTVELMEKHGLIAAGWKFKWDGAKRRLGCCSYSRKTIQLSRFYTKTLDVEEVKNTALHEIAHALAVIRFGRAGHGHGLYWKQVCCEIGAKPERCAKTTGSGVHAPYRLVHLESMKIFVQYYRKPSKVMRDVAKMWIRGKKEETYGKLLLVHVREDGEIIDVWPKKKQEVEPEFVLF